jgi:hypothetical protein
VTLRRKGDRLLVHLVNQNPGRDVAKLGTDDTWVDEIPEIGPFTLMLRLPASPWPVTWEPTGERLDAAWRRGTLTVTVPRFHIHGCVVLKASR